ncbi:MAG TPA: tetratricopeptide repeat protein [Thermoanaerobaculia bacterium]|jgi:tetratricopeptide (TPR) repeat protein|nr:tetratricopeptide repeat protein [Thermoanaerobaculia bacterium]
MAGSATHRIFLSAVTKELGSYRSEVARVLRRGEVDVREQDHFRQGSGTLLERLRDYIEQCDAVILLIGDRCGAFPTEEHAAALGPVPAFEVYRKATGQARASFTQWEYFLAKQYGKKTYIYLTAAGCTPDEPNSEDAALLACQAAYRGWLEASGKHYDSFASKAQLVEHVLVVQARPSDLRTAKVIHLPYASLGDLFQGREGVLSILHKKLSERKPGQATAIAGKAVHGLGGVGKSRLAIEYAWRYAAEYSAVLFVGAGTPSDLLRNFAALSGPAVLDLLEGEAEDEERQIAAVRRRLAEHPGWLLILDNIDSKEAAAAVDALIPRLQGGHVLLTGRLARWGAEVEPIELDVLAEQAAADFLLGRTKGRRRAAKGDSAEAIELARMLGFLPLALEQAGAYIAERRLTFSGYLKEWHSRHEQVLTWFDPDASHYPTSIAVTWQTSVEKLSPLARRLLKRLAWLGPEPIPESLLEVPVPGLAEDEVDPEPPATLAELATYSLVVRAADAPTFSVHRLVQDVTRRSLRRNLENTRLAEALRWVNKAFVGDPTDVRTWPVLRPLSPHAQAVVSFADAARMTVPTTRLMNDLAQLLKATNRLGEAEPLMRRALSIAEAIFGAGHPEVAIRLNNLALLLQSTNRLGEAEPLMRQALSIDEARFGADHPAVARKLNNLALLLQATNRLEEAEPLMRRALSIDESSFGADHPNIAIRLNNLAQLLKATNRLGEAEPLMRRALAIDEASFGADHPDVARDLNNLAALLKDTNHLGEAEPLMKRAVRIFESSLGENHPKVATALNNLAQLLKATSRFGEAEPLMRRALSIDEASFGTDHPNVAIRLNNLAALLQATNRLGEAEPLKRRALSIDEASFGADHPNVARDLNNLALLLKATNRLGEAEPLMRRALSIVLEFERRTGFEHPNRQAFSANYRALLRKTGKSDSEIESEIATLEAGLRSNSPASSPPLLPR